MSARMRRAVQAGASRAREWTFYLNVCRFDEVDECHVFNNKDPADERLSIRGLAQDGLAIKFTGTSTESCRAEISARLAFLGEPWCIQWRYLKVKGRTLLPLRKHQEPPDLEIIKTLVNTKTHYLYVAPNPGVGTIPLYIIERLPYEYSPNHFEASKEERLWGPFRRQEETATSPSSAKISCLVWEVLVQHYITRAKNFIQVSKGIGEYASFRGQIFEDLAYRIIPCGGTFSICGLEDDSRSEVEFPKPRTHAIQQNYQSE